MVSQCTIEHAVRLNEKMMGNVCKTFSAMYTYTLGQLQVCLLSFVYLLFN